MVKKRNAKVEKMKLQKPSPHFQLEVCCGDLHSAMSAVQGGACRIELCSALPLDGLTPSAGVLHTLRQRFPLRPDGTTDLLIHVLVRPREGDFVYSAEEVEAMLTDIREAIRLGASAIVSGALNPDGTLDVETTRRLVEAAAPLPFTFHRAFDCIPDRSQALRQLAELGVRRVLTSGGAPTAETGIEALSRLVAEANQLSELRQTLLSILPGGGVTHENVRRIVDATGATEIHGSCARRQADGRQSTDAAEVRAVLDCLHLTMP